MEKYNLKLLRTFLKILSDRLYEYNQDDYIYIFDLKVLSGVTKIQFNKFNIDFQNWFLEKYNNSENCNILQVVKSKDERFEFPLICDLLDYWIDKIDEDILK